MAHGPRWRCWLAAMLPGLLLASPALAQSTTRTIPFPLPPQTPTQSALSSNAALLARPGAFFGAQVNTTSVPVWVFLINATSLPADGALTWGVAPGNVVGGWQVAANSTLSVSESPSFILSTGVTLGCSTTGPLTLTASVSCIFGPGAVQ